MAKKITYDEHPCIFVDKFDVPHLNIFRNFFVETKLPKFHVKKKSTDDKMNEPNSVNEYQVDRMGTITISNDDGLDSTDSNGGDGIIYTPVNLNYNFGAMPTSSYQYESAMTRGIERVNEKRKKTGKIKAFVKRIREKRTPADKAFNEIKNNMRIPNTEDMAKSLKVVGDLYNMLDKSGQYEKAEQIKSYARTLSFEINLINHGITKYLLEKDVIDFMLKADRGIGITFLRYYNNLLPTDVMKKKIEIDNLMIFDNYVVLYYDPDQAIFRSHTKKEDERIAKDPILFGMIEGSNKLYYICDWVYKDDDITMDKVEKILGRQANSIMDSTVMDTAISVSDVLKSIETVKEVLSTKDNQESKK